jgi:transcription antitermination factor NusG
VVDRKNLGLKLSKAWERETFVEMLAELPDGASMGIEGETVTAAELSQDQIATLAEKLGKDDPPWLVGHSISREEAIDLGQDLPDLVARWLGVMLPVYRFAAWSRDNDFTDVSKQIQEEKAQKRRQATSYRQGDKVRIVGGIWKGKQGVVENVDTKAKVKVRVGKMSVVVSGHDLVPV